MTKHEPLTEALIEVVEGIIARARVERR